MEKRKWTEGIVATPTLETQSLEVDIIRVTMKQDEEVEYQEFYVFILDKKIGKGTIK